MSFTVAKEFMAVAVNNGAKTTMAKKGTLTLKKAAPAKKAGSGIFQKKKAPAPAKKSAPAGGRGTAAERQLWLPNTQPPEWLDGSMIGDRGFDPLGLGKPVEYYLFELDALEQNDPVNKSGNVFASLTPDTAAVSEDSLQPYNEVFDIQRFRECELIHGRWAMLGVMGAIVAELNTGVSWVDAGKVELEGSQYLGYGLPFDLTTLIIIEVVIMGYVEAARNSELDLEKRCYPGGAFDPLNLAEDPDRAVQLKTAEIKHARLAMLAFLGFTFQAGFTGTTSPVENLSFLN
ncbi:Chlorophyll a-b binding protein CP29.1, chloroplastic [Cymbomonas tetramitiformis]|uniref:Chlorophyll a-b binding protein, chloroplastic n=1 Tax=Cymbomonas tetramitiformis TaxID=36881 RepID=A0AAE0F9T7_9CHLO|nr:Chlorophyll a-b binding protein CP29.1, chloroplastic [Cymbomonas tetramitiformis]|eukprot:gene20854-25002_t